MSVRRNKHTHSVALNGGWVIKASEARLGLEGSGNDAASTFGHASSAHASAQQPLRLNWRVHFVNIVARWPQRPNWRALLHWIRACPSIRLLERAWRLVFVGSGMCCVEEGRSKCGRRSEDVERREAGKGEEDARVHMCFLLLSKKGGRRRKSFGIWLSNEATNATSAISQHLSWRGKICCS